MNSEQCMADGNFSKIFTSASQLAAIVMCKAFVDVDHDLDWE